MPLGALIGAPLAGWLVDYVGRKNALLYCSVPFAAGWLITVLSHIPDEATPVRVLLFAGRFIVGIGVGSTSLCVPVSCFLSVMRLGGCFNICMGYMSCTMV